MAILTVAQRAGIREYLARLRPNINYTKAQIDAALQAIEDRMTGTTNVGNRSVKAVISLDVDGAAPGIFSVAQKDDLFLIWSDFNRRRGGIV